MKTSRVSLWFLTALLAGAPAMAQDGPDPVPENPTRPGSTPPASSPPAIAGAGSIDINYVEADLMSLVEYFARVTGKNFILGDTRDLQGKKVTIISNKPVTPAAAYEAFLSSLEVHGLTTVKVGSTYKIIKASDAQQSPGPINQGGGIAATDNYVTQIITLENVAVSDVRQIIDQLVSPNAKVLAYAPSNSLILTDSGNNLRRIYKLVTELDIAAPKSSLQIYPIVYADAAEIMQLIEDLYGTAEAEQSSQSTSSRRSSRSSRSRRDNTPAQPEGVTAGKEAKYISKVLSEERTNSLIVLANEFGHDAVKDLIGKLDIDVDPQSRSQIYVYRLEHAKAEEVSRVLQDLSQGGRSGGGNSRQNQTNPNARVSAARARASQGGDAASSEGGSDVGGAIAAFDSGMRIAADENTNALVIIASRDDYAVVESVIKQLDVKRKQVFVEAVIMELTSTDGFNFNLAYHAPFDPGNGATGVAAAQFGTNSLGFDIASALTGFTFGIFGQNIDVPIVDPTSGQTTNLAVPAFGIALDAIKTMQTVNIVSSPSLMALDNEQAKIVVGRKIPFPTSNGLNALGQPVIQFQREDVAITLEVTPRVNSENFVTLEIKVEVQEIEDNEAVDVSQGGFITSKREIETVALVGDNQTVVLGGLVSSTDSESESKIPILGDLPLIGALFRNRSKSTRRSNLVVFLTPHIIDDDGDVEELMRVKEAQRQEFTRRFYGRSAGRQLEEIQRLLQYSMNIVERPSVYRGPATVAATATVSGEPLSASAREDVAEALERARMVDPGFGAGELPPNEVEIDLTGDGPDGDSSSDDAPMSETESTETDADTESAEGEDTESAEDDGADVEETTEETEPGE